VTWKWSQTFKNVSTYPIGDFISLKCLSRLLYMEPRESGSYSVPSSLSTPKKNLAIILSSSLGSVFQNFIIRAPPSFGGYPPYSNHSVRPHFLSYNNSWSYDLSKKCLQIHCNSSSTTRNSCPTKEGQWIVMFVLQKYFSAVYHPMSYLHGLVLMPKKLFIWWKSHVFILTYIVNMILDWLIDKGIITWCFSYWPSYRSSVCCIGVRLRLRPTQQTSDLLYNNLIEL
jgi:hypothetical protein